MRSKKKPVMEGLSTYSAGLVDLDYDILAMLPKQGTKMGKYHDVALRQTDVIHKLDDPMLTSSVINGRFQTLLVNGLAVGLAIPPVTQGRGYQITPKGEELLERHKTETGGAS